MALQHADPSISSSSRRIDPFPLARRASTVRRCAAELDALHGPAALLYWRTECRKLAEQLTKLGCGADEVRQQVLDFQDEVQCELVRLHDLAPESGLSA